MSIDRAKLREIMETGTPISIRFVSGLLDKLEAAERELAGVDEALARRPALDGIKGRYQQVYHACDTAARYEREKLALEQRVAELTEKLEKARKCDCGAPLGSSCGDCQRRWES